MTKKKSDIVSLQLELINYIYIYFKSLFCNVRTENCIPESIVASFTHDIFIKGCQTNFTTDGPNDVEVETLYPEETFRTLDECFNDFLGKIEDKPENEEVCTKSHVVEPLPIAATCA